MVLETNRTSQMVWRLPFCVRMPVWCHIISSFFYLLSSHWCLLYEEFHPRVCLFHEARLLYTTQECDNVRLNDPCTCSKLCTWDWVNNHNWPKCHEPIISYIEAHIKALLHYALFHCVLDVSSRFHFSLHFFLAFSLAFWIPTCWYQKREW